MKNRDLANLLNAAAAYIETPSDLSDREIIDLKENLLEAALELNDRNVDTVTLAECIHCGSITIEPENDKCGCGEELYPVTKTVMPGTRIKHADFQDIIPKSHKGE